jgi:hypothetical protein
MCCHFYRRASYDPGDRTRQSGDFQSKAGLIRKPHNISINLTEI